MSLSVVILAAGNGKRMKTQLPKVLHQLGGMSLLERVIKTAQSLDAKVYVVYGFGGEQVQAQLSHLDVQWVLQEERRGTGHAVLQALPFIAEEDRVLVLVGDSPLVSKSTLQNLLAQTRDDDVGVVTTELSDPTGFGRIIHDATGKVLGIVEHKDATEEQRAIKHINSGIITAKAKQLQHWLPNIKTNNLQGEYYLTDIIGMAVADGYPVHSVAAQSNEEVLGINDRLQLAKLERYYQRKVAEEFMLAGVTLLDPNRFDVRGEVTIAEDVIIDVNVILEGKVTIASNSKIGANCVIKNSSIGEAVEILPNSIIEGAMIEAQCTIGPFARIRPNTHLKTKAKVGNFVETKNIVLGEKSKANHLTYLGDATIGAGVNIGAGTITCNYDGVNKHHTEIKDGVFIGSNSSLVAPITIGENATIGAGSTITRTAPDHQLTVGRAKQTTIVGWERPAKKELTGEKPCAESSAP